MYLKTSPLSGANGLADRNLNVPLMLNIILKVISLPYLSNTYI